jgi:hypothetical protein
LISFEDGRESTIPSILLQIFLSPKNQKVMSEYYVNNDFTDMVQKRNNIKENCYKQYLFEPNESDQHEEWLLLSFLIINYTY